ncbi:MAG: tetratricopeptide repeat protein [Candidatus Sumerlaeaceae bacterium]|nr:tetratricopeptide repeat protein [Candidatus Sumerlaeaceae bacterium]
MMLSKRGHFLFVVCGALTLLHGVVHAEQFKVATKVLGFGSANDPVVYDIDADGRYEVLLTSVEGQVAAYALPSLERLWQTTLGSKGLTAPVVGNLLQTGEAIVTVASTSGEVFFLHGGSGKLVTTLSIGAPISVAPTVVWNDAASKSSRDAVVLCDETGKIYFVQFDGAVPSIRFSVPNTIEAPTGETIVLGRVNQPASIGDIDGDSSPEILVGTALGKVVAVCTNDPARRYIWHAPQGHSIGTNIVAADFFGLGRDVLVFGTNAGSLFAALYDPSSQQLKTAVSQIKLAGPAIGHLLCGDFDNDQMPDLVAATASALISYAPGAGFRTRGQPYGANAPPFSAVSLLALGDNNYRALAGDGKGLLHIVEPAKSALSAVANIQEIANSTLLTGNLSGSGHGELVFLGRNRTRLIYVGLIERGISGAQCPTLAFGGNFERNGRVTTTTLERIRERVGRFEQLLNEELKVAHNLYQEGRYSECKAKLDELLSHVATHPEALSLRRKTNLRQYWAWYLSGIIAFLGAAGGLVWVGVRVRSLRSAAERAEKLLEIQAYPQAVALLQQLRKKEPRNLAFLRLLAQAYILWERSTEEEALSVLEEAHRQFPDNSEFTIALARAYATRGNHSEEALELYQIALAVLEDDRGDLAYHAGRIYESRGELEQAIRCYRIAEKEGTSAPDVEERLVELYLATNQFNEKTLPLFEKQFPKRTQDPRFLEGLCRAQAVARRVDDQARAAASALLALRPDSAVALRQLAKCELRAGHAEQALHFAERAYEIDPHDDETTLVLAFCYSACEVLNSRTAEIFERALALEPDNGVLLRCAAVARLGPAGLVPDEATFELLKRAVQANPNDVYLLRALSREARKRGDIDGARRALEHLIELGETTSSIYCDLAEIYAQQDVTDAKAVPAYEEALRTDPENATYLVALARAYVRVNRKDPYALQVIERALHKAPQARDLGIFLATNYLEAERYEDALKLARWLLQSDKENEELQKLVAQASLAANRLDEAIAQFQYVLGRHPEDSEAWINLASAYARKHRVDADAAQAYAKALELSPNQPNVRFMLARHHAMAGRYGQALDQLSEILRSSPEYTKRLLDEVRLYLAHAPDRLDLRWFLVTLLTEMGQHNEACEELESLLALEPAETKNILQAYEQILGKDPMNAKALTGKARLLCAQGRHEAARPLLEQAYRIAPSDAQVRAELRELYETLLAESDDTEIRFELAKLFMVEDQYDKAIALLQKTVQDFRYENESIKLLGQCFMAKGMLEFAFQEFRKLLIDDEVKELLYSLAQRYEAKGDYVGAKQVYRVLFAADMNYRDVKQRFELLAGATSNPMELDRSTLITQLSDRARSRYELVEELGRGAMGIVYRARDNELDEFVALKILPENLSQNPEAVQRFRAEARAARRLAHPNIVRIHDIGEEKGRKYISMEFVKGTDLKRVLRQKGKLSIAEATSIVLSICEALEYAHKHGIVHRDIKPPNIMITDDGTPKLSDFGIAKALEFTGETRTGAVIGTPLYMSPEQVQGQPVDHRADIYSLGVMFYELLAGKPPFREGDIAYQHCRVAARPIPGIPEELNQIILKCLEKDRDQRWASAGELAQALRAWFEKWRVSQPHAGAE